MEGGSPDGPGQGNRNPSGKDSPPRVLSTPVTHRSRTARVWKEFPPVLVDDFRKIKTPGQKGSTGTTGRARKNNTGKHR